MRKFENSKRVGFDVLLTSHAYDMRLLIDEHLVCINKTTYLIENKSVCLQQMTNIIHT